MRQCTHCLTASEANSRVWDGRDRISRNGGIFSRMRSAAKPFKEDCPEQQCCGASHQTHGGVRTRSPVASLPRLANPRATTKPGISSPASRVKKDTSAGSKVVKASIVTEAILLPGTANRKDVILDEQTCGSGAQPAEEAETYSAVEVLEPWALAGHHNWQAAGSNRSSHLPPPRTKKSKIP